MEPTPLATDVRDPLDQPDSQVPRKPYTTPRLTKHGSIATQTGQPDFNLSGPTE